MKDYTITVNGEEFQVRSWDVDQACAAALRKFYCGKVQIYENVLWEIGSRKLEVTIKENNAEQDITNMDAISH